MRPLWWLAAASAGALASAARVETLFNDGWRFYLGDLPWACSTPASAAHFPIDTSGTVVHGLDDSPAGAGSAAACAALCAGNCSCQMWQFCPKLVGPSVCEAAAPPPPPAAAAAAPCGNNSASFPASLDGIQCSGLTGVGASSEAACAAACCGDAACEVYQWCGDAPAQACGPANSCWIGTLAASACKAESGWLSRARNVTLGAACQTGLLADYGPGNWQTTGAGGWVGAARLSPPVPPPQATGPAAPAYDDSAWEPLQLPHDYLARRTPTNVNATFHQNEHGSVPFSNAWYRKRFTVPASTTLARLYFDGAYRSAYVFLNGHLAAQHEEGYTAFSVWLHNVSGAPLQTGAGASNVVAVFLAATTYTYELWCYEGAGLVRDVTLVLHDAP